MFTLRINKNYKCKLKRNQRAYTKIRFFVKVVCSVQSKK